MRILVFVLALGLQMQSQGPRAPVEMTTKMDIDVDGAPNAYGPKGKPTLDWELNAHVGGKASGKIVGYMTKEDDHRTPVLQGPNDPYPGYYISTTGFLDNRNQTLADPRRYVDASKINYVVLGNFAASHGARLGDFVSVFSKRYKKSVYGIIGDSGNSSGAEGSLALLRALGYNFKDAKHGGVDQKEIVVRYYPRSNRNRHFFSTQAQIDEEAASLGLSKEFSSSF